MFFSRLIFFEKVNMFYDDSVCVKVEYNYMPWVVTVFSAGLMRDIGLLSSAKL